MYVWYCAYLSRLSKSLSLWGVLCAILSPAFLVCGGTISLRFATPVPPTSLPEVVPLLSLARITGLSASSSCSKRGRLVLLSPFSLSTPLVPSLPFMSTRVSSPSFAVVLCFVYGLMPSGGGISSVLAPRTGD